MYKNLLSTYSFWHTLERMYIRQYRKTVSRDFVKKQREGCFGYRNIYSLIIGLFDWDAIVKSCNVHYMNRSAESMLTMVFILIFTRIYFINDNWTSKSQTILFTITMEHNSSNKDNYRTMYLYICSEYFMTKRVNKIIFKSNVIVARYRGQKRRGMTILAVYK